MTDLSFARLVDIEQIRELLEAHYKITGIGAAILDTDENIMVAVGYHDICTRFHLIHPIAKLYCRESDAYIKAHLSECNGGYLNYRCKNGLVDVAVPIIIRGVHLATFFTGQFFYDDDKPDVEYFRKQAEKFGFDETGYLEALGRVPIFTRGQIHKIVDYYRNLVRIIAGMGLKNLELCNEAAERNQAEEALLLSRFCIDKAGIGIYRTDENGTIFSVNDYACTSLGYSKEELCALSVFEIDTAITGEKISEIKRMLDASGSATHETIHRRRDGTTFPVEITANLLEFHGKTFGISFVKDITERKQAEEALQKSRDELEVSVRERTEQLTSLTAELSLAEERERRRIATELHDQVGQALIFCKLKLNSLSHSLPSERFEIQIGEIRKYLDQSIQDIRSLTFQLSPPLLYEVGFEAAVEWLGEEFEEKYGFQVEFQDDGRKKPLDEEASVALYQMVRELLLNVAKHAKAKRVRISVGKVSGKIKIIVADDGSGFDSLNGMRRKNKKSGFGLFNIRHRIEYMGGGFKIKSKINQGTSVTLMLPAKADENSTNRKNP